jgi:hypothetical protein
MKNHFEYFIKNLDDISANVIQSSSIQKKSYVDVAEACINQYFQLSNGEFVFQIFVLVSLIISVATLTIMSSLYFVIGFVFCLLYWLLIIQYNKCTISTKVLAFTLLLNNIAKISKD